ncbi:MAG: response regulator [Deltaproteobacteria bacterium]|nr:response regulator [Deltaproteobacteria bacterium]
MPEKEPVEIKCSSCNTRFRLWIPAGLVSGWGEGERVCCIKCGSRFLIKKGIEGIEAVMAGEEPLATPQREVPQSCNSVLLVDDDRLSLAIASSTLSDMSVRLVTAKSGEEALEKIDEGDFALVITDLHLKNPGDPKSRMDGEDLLRSIASSGKPIPAIITTGKEIIDDLEMDPKWLDLRVRGFIQKGNPFWGEELKQKIKEVLELV